MDGGGPRQRRDPLLMPRASTTRLHDRASTSTAFPAEPPVETRGRRRFSTRSGAMAGTDGFHLCDRGNPLADRPGAFRPRLGRGTGPLSGREGRSPRGRALAAEALEEHAGVKQVLADLERMDPSERSYDVKVTSLIVDVRHHVEDEEGDMFPKLASAVPAAKLREMGERMEAAKEAAPTRPHPHAPATPPGNVLVGPVIAVFDRARDLVSGWSTEKATGAGEAGAKG
jgi:hypothetical protein